MFSHGNKCALILLSCVALTLVTNPVQAQSEQEICESIWKQYGLRGEGCPEGLEPPSEPSGPSLSGFNLPNPESYVSFERGGTELSGEARKQIDQLALVLQTAVMRNTCIQLVGHSDSSGPAEANDELAFKRAQVVAAALGSKLDDFSRIARVYSEGEAKPLDNIPSTAPVNRRVEIWARKCR